MRLIETTVAVNDARKRAMADRVGRALEGGLEGRTVGVLGLTFKPNTDDMRDSPALDILPALQAAGARVQVYKPEDMARRGFRYHGVGRGDPVAAQRP